MKPNKKPILSQKVFYFLLFLIAFRVPVFSFMLGFTEVIKININLLDLMLIYGFYFLFIKFPKSDIYKAFLRGFKKHENK